MGFGILLLGYSVVSIFSFLSSYEFIGMLIGYFLTFCALYELRKYAPAFLYSLVCCIIMVLVSFFETFRGLDVLFSLNLITMAPTIESIYNAALLALTLAFNLTLLYGIADISRRVELPEIRTRAFTNMIFVGISFAFQLFLLLPIKALQEELPFLMTLLMLLRIFCIFMNLWLFFKCYAFICDPSDEDMTPKPSRFAFVNKWRARNDAKEQEALDYYNKKIEEKKNKKNNKKKHKKK